jgi:hypothetical protein
MLRLPLQFSSLSTDSASKFGKTVQKRVGHEEMKEFKSNEEFFAAMRDLIDRIEKQGNAAATQELRSGFSCINGLTDGWALLMESIDKTIKANRNNIAHQEMSELHDMLKVVTKVVYRR